MRKLYATGMLAYSMPMRQFQEKNVMCEHAYAIPQGNGFKFCLSCKATVPCDDEPAEPQQLVMPPKIFEITERLWTQRAPWPLISFELAKKYQWYFSFLGTTEYLIMPVLKNSEAIYYSARIMNPDATKSKYLYPKGVKRSYWTSKDIFESNEVMICEGVADAVYCSNLGDSVAILGSYYNGSLDNSLRGRSVYLVLDGDSAGIIASVRICAQIRPIAKSVKVVVLPNKKDPTDLEVDELRSLIKGGTNG